MPNKQDVHKDFDLPRLATPEARRSEDFAKLRSVRIERDAILGDWPEATDADGYWDPFDAYYKNETPYMALVTCGTHDLSVKRFFERYGPIGQDMSSNTEKGAFRLEDFKLAQWRFRFALTLCKALSPDLLRQFLLKAIDDVWSNIERIERAGRAENRPATHSRSGAGRLIICEIADAARISRFNEQGQRLPGTLDSSWRQEVSEGIKSAEHQRLVNAARHYLSKNFWNNLKPARFRLDFPDGERPRMVVECHDLLVAFYWMLATDLDAGRAPLICANCKGFFFSTRKGATYCERQKCKERGRRTLDWDRHRARYNRNRRLKRRREKLQRVKRERR